MKIKWVKTAIGDRSASYKSADGRFRISVAQYFRRDKPLNWDVIDLETKQKKNFYKITEAKQWAADIFAN